MTKRSTHHATFVIERSYAARTEALLASGAPSPIALTGGYAAAFVVGAVFAAAAALLSAVLLRAGRHAPGQPPAEAVALPAKNS